MPFRGRDCGSASVGTDLWLGTAAAVVKRQQDPSIPPIATIIVHEMSLEGSRRPPTQRIHFLRSDHLRCSLLCLLLLFSPSPGAMAMKQASLGHWKSPISSELITSKVRRCCCAGDVAEGATSHPNQLCCTFSCAPGEDDVQGIAANNACTRRSCASARPACCPTVTSSGSSPGLLSRAAPWSCAGARVGCVRSDTRKHPGGVHVCEVLRCVPCVQVCNGRSRV